MKLSRRQLLGCGAVFLGFIFITAIRIERRVEIEVVNLRDTAIKDVRLSIGSSSAKLTSLEARSKKAVRLLPPRGESSLSVQYMDENGQTEEQALGGYYEKYYFGEVIVVIDEEAKAIFLNEGYLPRIAFDFWGQRFYVWNAPID